MPRLNQFLNTTAYDIISASSDANRGNLIAFGEDAGFTVGITTYSDPIHTDGYNAARGGLEVITGEGYFQDSVEGHFVTGPTQPDIGFSLSSNAIDTESTVTRTSGAGVFAAGDVGKGMMYQTGVAYITRFISTTSVTVAIRRPFPSTSVPVGWILGSVMMERYMQAAAGTPSFAPAATLTLSSASAEMLEITASVAAFSTVHEGMKIVQTPGAGKARIVTVTSSTRAVAILITAFSGTSFTSGLWGINNGGARPLFTWYDKGSRRVESVDLSSGVGKPVRMFFDDSLGDSALPGFSFAENKAVWNRSPHTRGEKYFDIDSNGISSRIGVADGTTTVTGVADTADLANNVIVYGAGVVSNTVITGRPTSTSFTTSIAIPAGTILFSFSGSAAYFRMTAFGDSITAPTVAWGASGIGSNANDRTFNLSMRSRTRTITHGLQFRAVDTANVNSILMELGQQGGYNDSLVHFGAANMPSAYPVQILSSDRNASAGTFEWLTRWDARNSAAVVTSVGVDQSGRMSFGNAPASTINPPASSAALYWDNTADAFKFRNAAGVVKTITAV